MCICLVIRVKRPQVSEEEHIEINRKILEKWLKEKIDVGNRNSCAHKWNNIAKALEEKNAISSNCFIQKITLHNRKA
jgi:hypothetical protein